MKKQLRTKGWARRVGDLRHGDTDTFLVRGKEPLLSVLVPIESSLSTPLFVLMQQSYDRGLQPLHALRQRVVLIGAAALAGALMFAALLAGGIAAAAE